MKNQYRRWDCLKRGGLGQLADLRGRSGGGGGGWGVGGGLAKKRGVVFLRGKLIPQCTLCKCYCIWVKIVEFRGRVPIDSPLIVMHYL